MDGWGTSPGRALSTGHPSPGSGWGQGHCHGFVAATDAKCYICMLCLLCNFLLRGLALAFF